MDIISELPIEIGLEIFKNLCCKDLAKCCLVSRNWRKLASSNCLWKIHYMNHGFPVELLFNQTPQTQGQLEEGEWYQKFLKEINLGINWMEGRFRAETIKEEYEEVLFMQNGTLAVFVSHLRLKIYSIDRNTFVKKVKLKNNNQKLVGHSDSSIVFKDSDSIYLTYTINEEKCSKHPKNIFINTNTKSKCVGVLKDTVCIESESTLYFYSALNGAETVVDQLDLEEPYFISLNDSLYVYNHDKLLEYNHLGEKTMNVKCDGDIIPPVYLFSNRSILLADSVSPEEEIWLSSRVLIAWDRETGKRLCRLSEKANALTVHPHLPIIYYVPKLINSTFSIVCYDVSKPSFLWETSTRLLSARLIKLHLSYVGNKYLYCTMGKLGSAELYEKEQFLLDLMTGMEYDYRKRIEDNYKFLWSHRERIAFVSTKETTGVKSVKIMSYNCR